MTDPAKTDWTAFMDLEPRRKTPQCARPAARKRAEATRRSLLRDLAKAMKVKDDQERWGRVLGLTRALLFNADHRLTLRLDAIEEELTTAGE